MKRTRLLCAGALLVCAVIQAQDLHFRNVNQNLIALNPSFAGSNGGIRDQLSYRNQWPRLSGTTVSYRNSFDMLLKKAHGGIAATWFSENFAHGLYTKTGFAASYAQYFTLKNSGLTLVPSVQLAYLERSVDVSRVSWPPPGMVFVLTASPPPSTRRGILSISSGFAGHYRRHLTFGAYFFHINQPDQGVLGESRMPMHSVVQGAYTFFFSERHLVQVLGIGQIEGSQRQARLCANAILFRHLIAGVGMSSGTEMLVNGGYHSRLFSVVLAWDASLSKLSGNTAGSWEILVSFNLRAREKRGQLVAFEQM